MDAASAIRFRLYSPEAVADRRRRGDWSRSSLAIARALLAALLGFASVASVAATASEASRAGSPQPSATLPPGTVLWLRLETPLSTKSCHLRQPVTARVVREVRESNGVAIPLGAIVRGSIEKLIPSSSPDDRARLLVRFAELETPAQPSLSVVGHVQEIENARESVQPDGTIRGLLASEVPVSHLEEAVAKLGKSNPEVAAEIEKAQKRHLGQSDTSIDYPAGTDLALALDQPLLVGRVFPPAVPDQLGATVSASVVSLLADAPLRSEGKDGKPGDPLNLVLVGSADEIRRVFLAAGWSEAESKSDKSIWRTVRAVAANVGYGSAPVSQLYLYGRPEDLAFEKMLNTFTKRHHLRLWRSPKTTADGREIWLGGATHDTGFDIHPGVVSHAIDPDLDAERAKVGADLMVTGRVAAEQLVARPNPLSQGLTATGATWRTDGRLLGIDLKPGNVDSGAAGEASKP